MVLHRLHCWSLSGIGLEGMCIGSTIVLATTKKKGSSSERYYVCLIADPVVYC